MKTELHNAMNLILDAWDNQHNEHIAKDQIDTAIFWLKDYKKWLEWRNSRSNLYTTGNGDTDT